MCSLCPGRARAGICPVFAAHSPVGIDGSFLSLSLDPSGGMAAVRRDGKYWRGRVWRAGWGVTVNPRGWERGASRRILSVCPEWCGSGLRGLRRSPTTRRVTRPFHPPLLNLLCLSSPTPLTSHSETSALAHPLGNRSRGNFVLRLRCWASPNSRPQLWGRPFRAAAISQGVYAPVSPVPQELWRPKVRCRDAPLYSVLVSFFSKC